MGVSKCTGWTSMVIVTLAALEVTADLSLSGARCGQLVCSQHEYCSSESNRCSPCDQICTPENHNYDASLCEKQCQVYIHDTRYQERINLNHRDDDEVLSLKDTVQRLQFQISVVLIISCLVLVLLAAISVIKCWKYTRTHSNKISRIWNRKKNHSPKVSGKQYPTDLTHQNPHTESPKMGHKPELKIDMPVANINQKSTDAIKQVQSQPLSVRNLTNNTDITSTAVSIGDASTPKTISTSVSRRYPEEDSTLDFSYDNIGMAKTPSPNIHPTNESKF